MDAELFQEKMDPTHRMYLCRMLNVKDLSEDLLERYAQVKSLVDRIDGHLTPGDLAMIIVIVGFEGTKENVKVFDKKLTEEEIDIAYGDDNVIEEAVAISTDATGANEPALQPGTTPKPPDEGKAMIWSPGMPVNVFHEDELKQGRIVGIVEPAEGNKKALQLTVEFEGGGNETFDEDEVEAV